MDNQLAGARRFPLSKAFSYLGIYQYSQIYSRRLGGINIALGKEFPDDPLHTKPTIVIDSKLEGDDLIFVVEKMGK